MQYFMSKGVYMRRKRFFLILLPLLLSSCTPGASGVDGRDGKDGVGIKKTEISNGELLITLTNNEVINLGCIYEDKVELNFYFLEYSDKPLVTEYHERGEVVNLPTFAADAFEGYEDIHWYANIHGGTLDEDMNNNFEWKFEKEYGYLANQLVYNVNNIYAVATPKGV